MIAAAEKFAAIFPAIAVRLDEWHPCWRPTCVEDLTYVSLLQGEIVGLTIVEDSTGYPQINDTLENPTPDGAECYLIVLDEEVGIADTRRKAEFYLGEANHIRPVNPDQANLWFEQAADLLNMI